MIAETIYVLCALTSLACAFLLLRGYARSRHRLLLWCGLGFVGLFLNNVLLFLDLIVFPSVDLSAWRLVPAVLGLAVLCYGLIWDVEP
ncbi:MAG TPA: DUF5985 family protein [Candidatus Sulfotelmatobacter sp.]|nr:DUF5985 family protein [Candidatus Sulfotelmatobacter sp.]